MSRTIKCLSGVTILVAAVRLCGYGGADAFDEEGINVMQPVMGAAKNAGHTSACCDKPAGCEMGAAKNAGHTSAGCDDPAGCEMCVGKNAEQKPASTEVTEAIAELPAEDRAAAEKQKTCPVTDATLGSMGKPFKITVQERDVFLCCEMCRDAVTDDPEKYMAKLSE